MALDPENELARSYEARVRSLTQSVEQRGRELGILSHVAARVHAEDDEQAVFEIALEEILSRLGLAAAWIFTGTEHDRRLQLTAHRGLAPMFLERVKREGLGLCLCPEVFWTGHRMQARNTTQCPRMPEIVEGLESPVAHACIPLKFDGATKGVLNVAARPGEVFSDEELLFLETLGHQIGLAVERARHRRDSARLYEDARRAYRELREAQDRIIEQERMAVLGTFASGLAHEVRNPLNSIGLQLSVLERRIARLAPGVGAEMNELAMIIREEVRRLDRLVGDFLLFSRAGTLRDASGDLDAVADEVVTLLTPEANGWGVQLERRRVGGPARRLPIDAEKIKQVVINLVRNGIEAQPTGGDVTVDSGVVDGRARLAVHDRGPGLPEGVDVFQLFVTTKPKGTGLGLAIVQQIVHDHGGEIRTGRSPGGGASFIIDLPLGGTADREGAGT